MREFVVITGMSGAGRSLAGDTLEDLGWQVIDNLPPALIRPLLAEADKAESTLDRVALVLGASPDQSQVKPAVEVLRETKAPVRVVFLEARPRVLVSRYESVRRRHPLDDGRGLEKAISDEVIALEQVRAEADLVIDTSELNVHGLRERLQQYFETSMPGIHTRVVSFGYKHGLPLDVDLVFDCRFLPNPHWDAALREFSGLDAPVVEFLENQEIARPFLERLEDMLDLVIPGYLAEGKSYLTLAFGCTGGRHRSVWMAERAAERLRKRGLSPAIAHRDIAE